MSSQSLLFQTHFEIWILIGPRELQFPYLDDETLIVSKEPITSEIRSLFEMKSHNTDYL